MLEQKKRQHKRPGVGQHRVSGKVMQKQCVVLSRKPRSGVVNRVSPENV
jgi:hypothetical protein